MPKSSKYLPRFHDPAILHEFNEHRLRDLLLPHAGFLASHGAALAETTTALDVPAIAKVILQPHDDTPYELVDALTHIHEMATPEFLALVKGDGGRVVYGASGADWPLGAPVATGWRSRLWTESQDPRSERPNRGRRRLGIWDSGRVYACSQSACHSVMESKWTPPGFTAKLSRPRGR